MTFEVGDSAWISDCSETQIMYSLGQRWANNKAQLNPLFKSAEYISDASKIEYSMSYSLFFF